MTGRNPERLKRAASGVDALSTATFDAADPALLQRLFQDLPTAANSLSPGKRAAEAATGVDEPGGGAVL